MFLEKSYEDLAVGTEIIAVEGMPIEALIEAMAEVIPHENLNLVRSRMIEYPYQNYHVFSYWNLSRLFGKKSSYRIAFKGEFGEITRECLLVKYEGYLDFKEQNHVYYEVQGSRLVLHLDTCICDDTYTRVLEKVAMRCQADKIDTLELDLSKNMGGNASVIPLFLEYIDVDSYRMYEMIEYSGEGACVVTSRDKEVVNKKKELLFPRNLYCRVSHTTFSSARTFAVTLKDNGLALIVGSSTGGKPSSYGMPRRLITPNCHLRFRVSRCLFLRPSKRLDKEMALYPDL